MLVLLSRLYAIAQAQEPIGFPDGVCDHPAIEFLPFCNGSLPLPQRVDDLVQRIPLAHAPQLLVDQSSGFQPLHLPYYGWWSEALHGVAKSPAVTFRAPTPFATSFPQVLTVASSFNRSLFHEVAQVIATEARAFYNSRNAGLTYWAPNINIFRDPRWGRGHETPGEDPFLTGQYAIQFVRGMQGDAKFLKTSACCKHFSAYSQETERHSNDAIVTPRDLHDTYLPAFQDCITRGHVSSIMCSYNAVNGVPSCADEELLNGLLRGRWGFDGYITSDCEAVNDVLSPHHYTQNPERTCATTLSAGMDMSCGEFLRQHLPNAISKGVVTREMVQTALKHLFRVQMRLGMFEKGSQPFSEITADHVDTPAHRQLALEAALQSVVLLKNEQQLLPLPALKAASTLALVGPHLNASHALLGNYEGIPSHISTPLEAIQSLIHETTSRAQVVFALGGNLTSGSDSDMAQVVDAVRDAEQSVLIVGIDTSIEREELDRTSISLPAHQQRLIGKVLETAPKPVVLVLIAGGCVDLSAYKHDARVGAIVFGGYAGQAGGEALAQVLFGKVNPSGRLSQTFYDSSFVENVSLYDMHMRPTPATGNPGRTYRFYQGQAVYEFGHGLSYAVFDLSWASSPPAQLDLQRLQRLLELESSQLTEVPATECALELTIDVNLSPLSSFELPSDLTLLCFAYPPDAGANGNPIKSLVGFERVPGVTKQRSQQVEMCLSAKAFALFDEYKSAWSIRPGAWTLEIDQQLRVTIQVEAAPLATE